MSSTQRLCIVCGKRAELYNNLCENCFRARTKLVIVPEIFNTVICAHCNSILLGKKWLKFENLSSGVARVIEKNIEWNELSKERKLNFKFDFKTEIADVKILAEGTILGLKLETIENAKIKLKKATCIACSKRFGGYYESIVQIRSYTGRLSKEQINESLSSVKNIVATYDTNTFLTKYEELPEGLDLYLSTTAIGRKVAAAIAKKYNAKIKISRALVTRRAGRNIYRVTFSVRIS
ncbi:MAG: 60S ribosomal export protein NMD3 [Candidatus Thermoplasmatota archaeon]|nr:60S ribosomal export protein NMD3 [Candidatus Thermoplasmatota archaeon]